MKRKQKTTKARRLAQHTRRHLKRAFVPHKDNQFRPHLVRRHALAAFLIVIIGVQTVYALTAGGSVLGMETTITEQQLLKDTNERRTQYGLHALKLNTALSRAAAMRANDMFKRQYWAHEAPDGTTPWYWVEKANYNYMAAGENLARGFTTSGAAVTAWMSSPEHRKNVLGEAYVDVGFAAAKGVLNGKSTTLIVALYGQPATTPMAGLVSTVAPDHSPLGFMARLGVAQQSMRPAVVFSLFLLLILALVALAAHAYRRKLPKDLRVGWYRHHGLLKAASMASFAVIVVFLYSSGQI